MTGKPRRIIEKTKLPLVAVSRYGLSRVEPVNMRDALGVGRHIVIGLPEETTGIFDGQDLTDFIQRAEQLRRSGVKTVNCVVSGRAHAVHKWGHQVDPEQRLCFYADPRLDFAYALDLVLETPEETPPLRSLRYILMVQDGVIKRARIEQIETAPEPEEPDTVSEPEEDPDMLML